VINHLGDWLLTKNGHLEHFEMAISILGKPKRRVLEYPVSARYPTFFDDIQPKVKFVNMATLPDNFVVHQSNTKSVNMAHLR
jgi:hypothetical protein